MNEQPPTIAGHPPFPPDPTQRLATSGQIT